MPLPAALPDHSLLPCGVLWSSVELSTEIQTTSIGVFGELWIPGLQLRVYMRPPGIPERNPALNDWLPGHPGGEEQVSHWFLLETSKLGHSEDFYGLLHVHKIPIVDNLLGYTDF